MKKFVMGIDAPDAATHVLTWSTPSPWALLAPGDVVIPVDADLYAGVGDMAALAGSVLGHFYFVIPAGR